MKARRLLAHLLLCVGLVCFYAASYQALLQQRQEINRTTARHHGNGIWELPPMALCALAGEFKGLMADYLTLEAGARLGTELVRNPGGGFRIVKKEYDWHAIHRLFVASQILDPSFAQTYIVAQGWLPWDGHMVNETQGILRTAALNRPWDWQPFHLMGFNEYYFLKQPGEAGKFFLEAAKTPNAPPFLAILGARLAQKGGETETAIIVMKSMLAGKDESEPGYQDIVERLQALEGTLVLERAVVAFRKRSGGAPPDSPEELIATGLLPALPVNPYKLPYCIGLDGTVFFDNPKCREAR